MRGKVPGLIVTEGPYVRSEEWRGGAVRKRRGASRAIMKIVLNIQGALTSTISPRNSG